MFWEVFEFCHFSKMFSSVSIFLLVVLNVRLLIENLSLS